MPSKSDIKIKVKNFVTNTNFLATVVLILTFICGGLVSYLIFGNKEPTVIIIEDCTSTVPSTTRTTTTTIEFPRDLELLNLPIKRIIVGHTTGESCLTRDECLLRIQQIREESSDLRAIPWNFLVGGDGIVYEGRGYRYEGEHTSSTNASNFNDIGLGIAFIGNYRSTKPSSVMIEAFTHFIAGMINEGVILEEHFIFLQDQLIYKEFEATELKNSLRELENFYECERKF